MAAYDIAEKLCVVYESAYLTMNDHSENINDMNGNNYKFEDNPYYEMYLRSKQTVDTFEALAKNLIDLNINETTIRKELEKLKGWNLLQNKSTYYIDKLLCL